MIDFLRRLGPLGGASILLLGASAAVLVAVVLPLQETSDRLDRELQNASQEAAPDGLKRVSAAPVSQLAAFYEFFDRSETVDTWLAKLYGAATAAGVELRAGDYRLADSRYHFDRYHISLPVRGSYAQIRAFLEGALAEIPVLSLDHVGFRRKGTSEPRVEADIVLTLHLRAR